MSKDRMKEEVGSIVGPFESGPPSENEKQYQVVSARNADDKMTVRGLMEATSEAVRRMVESGGDEQIISEV